MDRGDRHGEEFRTDLRPLAKAAAGSGNASARRILSAAELAPLTELSDLRSLAAVAQTVGVIALAIAFGLWAWPSPWVALSIVVVGVQQHGLFILAHEAAHYRLFRRRAVNDAVGRLIGMAGAISMCTYRVIHRLHHNNLYSAEDPDTAIHGGYPRGTRLPLEEARPGRDRLERVEDLRLLLRRAGAQRGNAARGPAARRHLGRTAPLGAGRSLVRGRVPGPRAARLPGPRRLARAGAVRDVLARADAHRPAADPAPARDLRARRGRRLLLAADGGALQPQRRRRRSTRSAVRCCSRITSTTTSSTTSIRRCRTIACRACTACSMDKGALEGAEVRDLDETFGLDLRAARRASPPHPEPA